MARIAVYRAFWTYWYPRKLRSYHKTSNPGQAGTGPFVIEASRGGCTPDNSCIASYLLAAEPFTYLGCLQDEPQLPHYPDLSRRLGAPSGPAVQGGDGVWSRSFAHGVTARWYPKANHGTVQWAGEPVPPAPAPLPPPPPIDPEVCGAILQDHTFAQDDIQHLYSRSASECCKLCSANKRCTQWAWHGSTDHSCHLHNASSVLRVQKGTTAAYMPKMTQGWTVNPGGGVAPAPTVRSPQPSINITLTWY